MKDKTEFHKMFNSCLEGNACKDFMHRMMGLKGVDSPCADMMKKMMDQHGEGGSFSCAEMLESMMKGGCGMKAESPKTQAE